MKNIQLFVGLLAVLMLMSCEEDSVVSLVDPSIQRAEDLAIIEDYIEEKGYTNVDTTASGVRYAIIEEGTGKSIAFNDIVQIHYAGRLTDGTLFDTSIDTVAINNDSFDSLKTYNPIRFTYAQGGWTLGSYVEGFKEGVTASLGKMKVGGSASIMIPSSLGYGTSPPFGSGIPTRAVLVFEVYPVSAK